MATPKKKTTAKTKKAEAANPTEVLVPAEDGTKYPEEDPRKGSQRLLEGEDERTLEDRLREAGLFVKQEGYSEELEHHTITLARIGDSQDEAKDITSQGDSRLNALKASIISARSHGLM